LARYPGNLAEERDVDNPNAMDLQELSDLLTADASQSHITTVEIGIGDSLPGLQGVVFRLWRRFRVKSGSGPFGIMLQHRES